MPIHLEVKGRSHRVEGLVRSCENKKDLFGTSINFSR